MNKVHDWSVYCILTSSRVWAAGYGWVVNLILSNRRLSFFNSRLSSRSDSCFRLSFPLGLASFRYAFPLFCWYFRFPLFGSCFSFSLSTTPRTQFATAFYPEFCGVLGPSNKCSSDKQNVNPLLAQTLYTNVGREARIYSSNELPFLNSTAPFKSHQTLSGEHICGTNLWGLK